MDELINFLQDFKHIEIVYFFDDTWSIHKPKGIYTTKTREEILKEKKSKKK